MKKYGIRACILIVLASAALLLSGCMGTYGRIKADERLTDIFKNRQALPDFNYYYCGRDKLPYAVIGLDPAYELQDRLWHKLETKAEIHARAAGIIAWSPEWARGAMILDPSGKQVGIWFSYYNTTTVKLGPENQVTVYNPYSPNTRQALRTEP